MISSCSNSVSRSWKCFSASATGRERRWTGWITFIFIYLFFIDCTSARSMRTVSSHLQCQCAIFTAPVVVGLSELELLQWTSSQIPSVWCNIYQWCYIIFISIATYPWGTWGASVPRTTFLSPICCWKSWRCERWTLCPSPCRSACWTAAEQASASRPVRQEHASHWNYCQRNVMSLNFPGPTFR